MAGPDLNGLVNGDMLAWAREQSRLDLETAADRAQVTQEKLQGWEAGDRAPTLAQLRKLAVVYKRSVGVFFLRERPTGAKRRPIDFRRAGMDEVGPDAAALELAIRDAGVKRDAALDIFTQIEEEPPAWTLPSIAQLDGASAALVLAQALGITGAVRAGWKTQYEALNGWKAAVEGLGALVLQLSGVSTDRLRGFSIADYPLPVVALNGADSPLGRIFTLIHELAHLARREPALCDLHEEGGRNSELVEQFCNYVAGSVLVPSDELLAVQEVACATEATEWTMESLTPLARRFWVSKEVVLRRLLILGRTNQNCYASMRARFLEEYAALRREPSGPVPYYRLVIQRNGRFLTRLALDAYGAHAITGSELSKILNTKLDHLPKIRSEMTPAVAV